MEMKIKINLDQATIQREIDQRCQREADKAINTAIGELFNPRQRWGQPEGLLHEMVRKRIEEYVLSDKFASKLDGWIERNMDQALDHSGEKIINWAARKRLFMATKKGLENDQG